MSDVPTANDNDSDYNQEPDSDQTLETVPESVERELEEALSELPDEQRQAVNKAMKLVMQVTRVEQHSGPLPHPRIIREYEEIIPGGADRIIKMAELEQSQRHELEKQVLQIDRDANRATIDTDRMGMLSALIVALVTLIGGIYLLSIGIDIGGLVLLLAPLVGIAGVFYYSRRQQSLPDKSAEDQNSDETKDEI